MLCFVGQNILMFCPLRYEWRFPISMEDFASAWQNSELQKKIIQTNMCSVPPNPCDEHSINQRIGGERRETILQFSMKSNSMPVARMGKVAVPDDDWVSIGRWMNLLSARDPNLRNFPPPCKFQRSSSVDGIMQRTTSFSPKTKRVSRDLSAPVRPYTIQVFVWLWQSEAFYEDNSCVERFASHRTAGRTACMPDGLLLSSFRQKSRPTPRRSMTASPELPQPVLILDDPRPSDA